MLRQVVGNVLGERYGCVESLIHKGEQLLLQTGLSIYQEDARTLVGFRDETYLHQDQLGSTILTTGKSGEDRRPVHYDAFGQVLSRRVTTPGHLYNGKPRDPMTGLVNYGFRDYDPRQGRFTRWTRSGTAPTGMGTW